MVDAGGVCGLIFVVVHLYAGAVADPQKSYSDVEHRLHQAES